MKLLKTSASSHLQPTKLTLRGSLLVSSLSALLLSSAMALEPGQAEPKRVYSNGDSITRGFNSNVPLDNKNLSWVNGYHGFWQWLFGQPDINAHNQRISDRYGSRSRKNYMGAKTGAATDDFLRQANNSAGKNVTYASVLLGSNDVCSSSPAALPSDAEFESNVRAGMQSLVNNVKNGATISVVGIPDIRQLYDVGQDKNALGIINCPFVWDTINICGAMLSSDNSEADRAYVQSRNQGYNQILENLAAESQANAAAMGKTLFVEYTDIFDVAFTAGDVSNIDCFHPAPSGQALLSDVTWQRSSISN